VVNIIDNPELIPALNKLARLAYHEAKQAHDYAFSDKIHQYQASLSYLNLAMSYISAAEALYYSRFDVLEHNDIEVVFQKFRAFANELLTNYATDHSHQWTDIEFERLKDSFDDSVLNFNNG